MASEVVVAGPDGCPDCGVAAGAPHADTCIRVARADYEAAFGKRPFPGWSLETLHQKINAAKIAAASGALTQSDATTTGTMSDCPTVMLMCGHIYLPEDPTVADWEGATTVRYEGKTGERRTRVQCHPSLADFLQKRQQAEII